MTKEKLEEIKDSIELQMMFQQCLGYKNKYDAILTEEIDLYNEVIDLQERIENAIDKLYCWGEVLDADFQQEMLLILKEFEEVEQ